jgi:anaerobic magnesium-protoporphyrin IX monomethyl ester cyclase
MSTSVLLTILPPWGRPTLPIGLGYLSQTLAVHGVQHQVLDLNLSVFDQVGEAAAELWRPQHAAAWVEEQQFPTTLARLEPAIADGVQRLAAADVALVGFSVNQSNARMSIEAARRLRRLRPGSVIVFGGLGVYVDGERRLVPPGLVDLFVIGEGERTLLEVVRRVEQGAPLTGIPGTLTDPSQRLDEQRPPAPVDLKRHHWPDYGKFAVERYPDRGQPMPVTLGRGCVCRCSFCGDYPFWGRYRSRSGDDVADEVEHHVRCHGVRRFEFNDLAINGDLEALAAFCDSVVKRGLEIEWSSYAYFRRMPEEIAHKLRLSGCVMLRFGMESASDALLERMRKPHRSALAAQVLAELTRAGIHCNIGLMVGFPDETQQELEETATFLRENAANIHEVDSLSVFYIKPLSEVEQDPDRYGVRFPEDHTTRWNRWLGRDGSTHRRRVERAQWLARVIEESGIRFQRCNIIGV